jgi:hypothetical protein
MSTYDYLFRHERKQERNLTPESLLDHRGDQHAFARKYEKVARKAVAQGTTGIRDLAPQLLAFIAEPKNLKTAWNYLAMHGGPAPGVDRYRYCEYGDLEAWSLCRALGGAILSGTYRPNTERILHITKESGRGTRELRLPCIADRTVERATVQILQPLLDPHFRSYSFGYRPGRSVQQALATAESLAQRYDRWNWVSHDVKDAFTHVPLPRLMDILRMRFRDERLVKFLATCLTSMHPGLRQGGPLSPLLLNVYLDHFLDRVWRKRFPQIPLIRFADDILLLCADRAEAVDAEAALRKIVADAGMQLKATPQDAIRDLSGGQTTEWMGLHLYRAEGGLAMELTHAAWGRLRKGFRRAHEKDGSQLAAEHLVLGWLNAHGLCYRKCESGRDCLRIVRTAAKHGFEEILDRDELEQMWQLAYARWRRLRKRVRRQIRKDQSSVVSIG